MWMKNPSAPTFESNRHSAEGDALHPPVRLLFAVTGRQ